MGKITKDMLIIDCLKQGNKEKIAEVLYNAGMHCLGCALAHGETVEQAADAHGVAVEDLVKDLNTAAASK
jgi:hybrid cluster-associated redox disulfide protein